LAIDLVGSLSPFCAGGRRVRIAFVGLGAAALSTVLSSPIHPAFAAGPSASATVLTSTAAPVAPGEGVTLTATVSGHGVGPPTGSVSFSERDETPVGTAALADGTATLTVSLPPGTHAIIASYGGDLGFLPSWSDTLTLRWGPPVGATVALTATPSQAPAGYPVTLTATVDPVTGTALATGDVTFSDGQNLLGIAALAPPQPAADGVATLTITTLSAGAHSLTAAYIGDGNLDPDTSDAASAVIGQPILTTTSLAAGPDPSTAGQVVSFTVSVSAPGASSFPTGTVALTENGVALATAAIGAGSAAVLALSSLAPGTHQIAAAYGGDANFAPSTSPATAQVVLGGGNVPTSVSLQPAAQPVFGQALTVTATVSPPGLGSGIPTGTVTFANAGSPLGAAAVGADGTASLTFPPLAGTLSLTAAYGGDATFASSVTSFALGLLVLRMASAMQVSANPTAAVAGQPVTFTARVAPATAAAVAAVAPSGQVAFVDGAAALGTAELDSSGTATLAVASLAPGSHSVVAQYLGDGNYESSNAASLVETVTRAPVSVPPQLGPGPPPIRQNPAAAG
jgi:Bacterial Ig-like domain (group 3)